MADAASDAHRSELASLRQQHEADAAALTESNDAALLALRAEHAMAFDATTRECAQLTSQVERLTAEVRAADQAREASDAKAVEAEHHLKVSRSTVEAQSEQRAHLAGEIERLTVLVDSQREDLSNASASSNRLTARVEGLQSELEWRQTSMKAREEALEANTRRDEETNAMKLELMQVR